MDADTLKGMAVVSIAEAARLGTISDVLFETTPLRVGALLVTGAETEFVIPFAEVRTLGKDAVTVSSSEVTQMARAGTTIAALRGLGDLGRLKVLDEAGTLLGTLRKVELDPTSGEVTALVAHRGGALGLGGTDTPIDVAAVRSVGGEVLTVATEGKI